MLPLPQFSSDVPAYLEYSNGQGNSIVLARALLEAGVLCEDDWSGVLGQSIEQGLTRWLGEQTAHYTFRRLGMNLAFTDDVYGENNLVNQTLIEPPRWNGKPRPIETVYGMFALTHNPYSPLCDACVGNRVLDLEELHPGAGFALLHLVCTAIEKIHGWTPGRALEFCQEQFEWLRYEGFDLYADEGNSDDNEPYDAETVTDKWLEEQSGKLSPASLKSDLPRELFRAKTSLAPMKRALNGIGAWARDDADAFLLRNGLDLAALLRSQKRVFSKRVAQGIADVPFMISATPAIPVVLYWNESDDITRAFDDKIEEMNQGADYVSDVVWFSSFALHDAASVARAVEDVRLQLQILRVLDTLLQGLHSDEPLRQRRQRARVRVGKSLAEVFAQGENDAT